MESDQIKLWTYWTVPGDAEHMVALHFNSGVVAATEAEINQIKEQLGDHEGSEVNFAPFHLASMDTLREEIFWALEAHHDEVTVEGLCEGDKVFDPDKAA